MLNINAFLANKNHHGFQFSIFDFYNIRQCKIESSNVSSKNFSIFPFILIFIITLFFIFLILILTKKKTFFSSSFQLHVYFRFLVLTMFDFLNDLVHHSNFQRAKRNIND